MNKILEEIIKDIKTEGKGQDWIEYHFCKGMRVGLKLDKEQANGMVDLISARESAKSKL